MTEPEDSGAREPRAERQAGRGTPDGPRTPRLTPPLRVRAAPRAPAPAGRAGRSLGGLLLLLFLAAAAAGVFVWLPGQTHLAVGAGGGEEEPSARPGTSGAEPPLPQTAGARDESPETSRDPGSSPGEPAATTTSDRPRRPRAAATATGAATADPARPASGGSPRAAGRPSAPPPELPAAPRTPRLVPQPEPPAPEASSTAAVPGPDRTDGYAAAMSRGLAALADDRLPAALEAFSAAAKIRPGAREVAEARLETEQRIRAATLRELLAQGRRLEAAEAWSDALERWEKALEIDPTLAEARRGRARSTARAELAGRLDAFLDRPERLATPAVREEARDLLDRARAVAERDGGARLEARLARLGALVAEASRPVRVRLESDGRTEVTVYRVGRLGTFTERSLELTPGSYTVVGSCDGYRDVRHRLVVEAGAPPEPLEVVCEERI